MLIQSMYQAVLEGRAFDIGYDLHCKKALQIRSFGHCVLHLGDTSYHAASIGRITDVLIKALEKLPMLPVAKALDHVTVNCARLFLKSLDASELLDAKVQKCSRLLLAAKLGCDLEVFDNNPGFEDFAKNSHLERYLEHFGLDLKVTAKKELLILCEGKYLPWEKAFAVWNDRCPALSLDGSPTLEWNFGQQGVQKKDLYGWQKWEPYKIEENHDWGDRYIFEFSACCNESFALHGDHTWLRLKTPKGEIYSVGLYRPGKGNWTSNLNFPMRIKKGFLMSPDVSEFWPMPIHRIAAEISEDQFNKIRASVDKDKENEQMLAFQIFNGNCTEYVTDKAAMAGIKLPTAINVLESIAPPPLPALVKGAMRLMPELICAICVLAATILINLVQVSLGAHLIDEKLKEKQISLKPHIGSVADLFNPDKLNFHPPRHLGLKVREDIEKWREREIKKIEQLPSFSKNIHFWNKEKEILRFKLPKKYHSN